MKKQKKTEQNHFPVQFKIKHKWLKAMILVSFFVGFSQIAFPKKFPDLPYDDSQPIPGTTPYDTTEKYQIELGLQAYEHLIDVLYEKCQNMGINLQDGYLVQVVAYDMMTNSIDVILQRDFQSVHLKVSAENLTNQSVTLNNGTYSDQISQLTNFLDAPILETPVYTTISPQLKSSLQTSFYGVQNYARTNVQFSDGDKRNENNLYGLIAGRDYEFFNIYGKGTKDGVEYNTVTTIAMNVDDMEIAEIYDLIEFYILNPQDERFVINLSYQETVKTLEKLNEQSPEFNFEQ